MVKIISLFNHKGGVSKTTTSFNVGWSLAKKGLNVLLVDADPQSNLTSLALSLPDDAAFETLYTRKDSNDIFSLVNKFRTTMRMEINSSDSISNIVPTKQENLFILPGHLQIEEFSTQITLALSLGQSPQFEMMRNIPGYLNFALRRIAEIHQIDYIIIDMAPSLSGLNEALLMSSDYFIAPCSPDFFSEIALKNLSRFVPQWYTETSNYKSDYPLPSKPLFIGVIQQNFRPRNDQPTQSFQKWIERVSIATNQSLVPELSKIGLAMDAKIFASVVKEQRPYNISLIPDFNSLIATSQTVNKPVFELTSKDLRSCSNIFGRSLEITQESVEKFKKTFEDLAENLIKLTTINNC